MTNVDVTVGTNKKLIPRFRGPYVVYKVLDNDRYAIKDIPNCQLTQKPYDNVLEAARLRAWVKDMCGTADVTNELDTAVGVIEAITMSGSPSCNMYNVYTVGVETALKYGYETEIVRNCNRLTVAPGSITHRRCAARPLVERLTPTRA